MPPQVPALVPDLSAALSFPLHFAVSLHVLVLAFALVVVFWGVFTAIFIYHWRRFPYDRPLLRNGERLYLSVSLILIIIALGGLIFA